ncbi:MAG: hypothetical protein RSC58_05560 [Ruthenibacterium sp.]
MQNKTRYAVVMLLCVVCNTAFYELALAMHWPVWLDVTGTALAALTLEPTAGLLVGLANNFLLAILQGDASSLFYYAVSADVALIVGIYMRKDGKILLKRIVPTLLLVIVSTSILSTALTLWRSGGTLDTWSELAAYEWLTSLGMPHLLALFGGTGIIKALDTVATGGLVALLYLLLPKSLKHAPQAKKLQT